jgi:hypothetical protein
MDMTVVLPDPYLSYHNQGKNTSVLYTKSRYMDCTIREATETELQLNSTNREDGFCTRKSWKPPIYHLKEHRKNPLKNSL